MTTQLTKEQQERDEQFLRTRAALAQARRDQEKQQKFLSQLAARKEFELERKAAHCK